MLVLLCLSSDEADFSPAGIWSLLSVIVWFVRYMHECTWVMYSSVSLKRSEGSDRAGGAITAGTNLLPLVDVCLASFVFTYFYIPYSVYFPSTSYNSVGTLKRKQQIMSKPYFWFSSLANDTCGSWKNCVIVKKIAMRQVDNFPFCLST